MPAPMPAIDVALCSSWDEIELGMYHSYPFFLVKYDIGFRETYATHSKMDGKRKWTPNMGPTMKGVRKEPSPHIRNEANPVELNLPAVKDILDVREVEIEARLKHHKFESRAFTFYPMFHDFLKDHMSATAKDIVQKKLRYEDLYSRTAKFHMSPHVFVCNRAGNEIVAGPMWDGKSASTLTAQGKSVSWRQAVLAQLGNPGNLSIANCFLVDSFLREDIRATPWSDGSSNQPADNSPMPGKNVLILSSEAYNQFRFDPFLLDNRRIDLDIVQKGFKGSIGDNIICRIEDLPLRMSADGTFPVPQTREMSSDVYNTNETITADPYKDAPYEWAWMYAADGYEMLDSGPPPSEFTGDDAPENFQGMTWNGEVKLTRNFLHQCVDENGVTVWESNTYGEYMKYICHLTLGILGTQRRNVIPILFKRVRGVLNS